MEATKKKRKELNPFVIVFVVIFACWVATYLIPGGAYDRVEENGVVSVVADSYHAVDKEPLSVFDLFLSIPQGMVMSAGLMALVFLTTGAIGVFNKTGALTVGMSHLMGGVYKRFGSEKGAPIVLFCVMLIFAVLGGVLGWIEGGIPFIPLFIPLILALGYDSMVAIASTALVMMIGFAYCPINVYTVGIAHDIAGLPMFSGMGYRVVVLVTCLAITMAYIFRYAAKVKADPSRSLVKDVDMTGLVDKDVATSETKKLNTTQKLVLLILAATIGVVVYGCTKYAWGYEPITAAFFIGGTAAGLISRLTPGEIADIYIAGAKDSVDAAMIIGTASGVSWILEQGGLIDPIVHATATPLSHLPPWAAAIGVFIVVTLLNGLVAGGSTKALILMPLLVPIADITGITRQTVTQAFQFGDGISNSFWITYGTLLIFLSLGRIPIGKWWKFVVPLLASLSVIAIIGLVIAVKINYGPF